MAGDRQLAVRRPGDLIRQTVSGMLFFACTIAAWGCRQDVPRQEPLLKRAKSALSTGDYQLAGDLAAQVPEASADWMAAMEIAGEAAAKAERPDEALRLYLALAKRQQQLREPPLGLFFAAETSRGQGRLTDSEQYLRQFLSVAPDNAATHERLAFLLTATGRRWEAQPHYLFLVRSGTATVTELILLGDDRPVDEREFLEECARTSPTDRVVQLGLAAHRFWEGHTAAAEEDLRAILKTAPDLLSAQAMLGELLLNRGDAFFIDWHNSLPASAELHPDIWFVRGLWARRQNQMRVAARCFWESVRLDPSHRRSMSQLAQLLVSLDQDAGRGFAERANQLIQLTQILDVVTKSESKQAEPFRQAVALLEQMGRVWEACAWALAARQKFPVAEWPSAVFARLAGSLGSDLPFVTDAENLALRYDYSSYPDFREALGRFTSTPLADQSRLRSAIQFVEDAAGPEFVYVNGSDPLTEEITDPVELERARKVDPRVRIRTRNRTRMFESNGGGVAVLDADVDGWPDLFFTQGAEWKHGSDGPTFSEDVTDRLFRNQHGRGFTDVTASLGVTDHGFGQGCAAGDFDNDGFPDLYVANVGRNQLLRNNGDGTFRDVTESSGLAGDDWTASCAIVDLNADGMPDLYDVNYLSGPGIYQAVCQGHACSPKVFAAAPDRVWLSRGDGTFESMRPMVDEPNGKGLGILAFDLHTPGRPDLFIANDQVPNFLLRNFPAPNRQNLRLEEEGFVSGVAFNQDGLAMASMGIAADDVNGDGRIDLFVTTFKDEPRLLFVQDATGLFVDATNAAGLRMPSLSYVGWGTQFLDADLDGEPDLVMVNGHVDDFRSEGGEYHMRPQFFRNTGLAKFVELKGDAGEYFERQYLGRGLARLDWNRDGLMDFAVCNMGARASLVINATQRAGHYLSVRLSARQTARDAIGAVIEVRAGNRTWRKQLVAGDGYMASNERLIQFGLGDATMVTELSVHWPSGTKTTVQQLPADATLELIESASHGILRRSPTESSVVPVATDRHE